MSPIDFMEGSITYDENKKELLFLRKHAYVITFIKRRNGTPEDVENFKDEIRSFLEKPSTSIHLEDDE